VSVEESQSNTQVSKLVFPKLLYLKLQSLSQFGEISKLGVPVYNELV